MKKVLVGMCALIACAGMAMAQVDWDSYNQRTKERTEKILAQQQQQKEDAQKKAQQAQEERNQRKLQNAFNQGRVMGNNAAGGFNTSGNTCDSKFTGNELESCDNGYDFGYNKTMESKNSNNNKN